MKDLISQFFLNNLDIVFFIYGLAFVIMGLAIWIQPRKESSFKIAPILGLLGIFGLTHGLNEWLDMWSIIRGQNQILDLTRWFLLVISFVFFFEFGRRLFRLTTQPSILWRKISMYLGWWLSPALVLFILIMGFMATDFWKIGSSLARYLLAFPAGLLIIVGLYYYYKQSVDILDALKMKRNIMIAGVALLIYSILGGLIVPKGDFFPANWLNTSSFAAVTGIPVQVFRAVCAIVISWSLVRILTIFNWEIKISEGISEQIMLLSPDFRIIWANKIFKDKNGLTDAEIVGRFCYAVTHHRTTPCQPPNDTCPIKEMQETGKPATTTHTHYDKEGKAFYARVTAYPIRNKRGEIVQFVHLTQDITDLISSYKKIESLVENLKDAQHNLEGKVAERTKELQETQEHLIRSEKLGTLGQLAGGIAHDFNNLLMVITGNAYLLKSEIIADKKTLQLLANIEQSAARGTDLTRKLLGFARRGKYVAVPINCNSIVKDVSALLSETIEKMISIEQHLEPNLWTVEADASQIHQVVLNICINAKQAMPYKGVITIETQNIEVSEEYAKTNIEAKPGKFIVIMVSDTGVGMDKETLKYMFEPFFTTKKPGEGTGLGLAMSYGIIKNHGGFINVYSEKGKGTCFKTYLPASDKPVAKEMPVKEEEILTKGTGTIMVVDDEPGVREVSKAMLERYGYQVITAQDGKEAIEIYQQKKNEIAMIILDLIMPGLSGKETYDELNKINPAVKVLISSGYSINGQAKEIFDTGVAGFIQKPFEIKTLLKEVKKLI